MKYLTQIFLFLFIFTLCGCLSKNAKTPGKLLVVTSIPPYTGLVREIVGETMVVASALNGSFDPHTSEPTPSQLKIVRDADLFIGIGEAYESKLIGATHKGSKHSIPILNIDKEIPLLSYSEDTNFINACTHQHHVSSASKDLHFWLSTKSLILQIKVLFKALSELMPENRAFYERNTNILLKKIENLNQKLEGNLKEYAGRSLIVSHAALGYFCHDFNLIQISIECDGKTPLPHTITQALEQAKNSNVICVFIAPQFDNRGAELIAQKLNLRLESFDYLSEDVLSTIEHIANAITQ